jgi:hypothetical protein
MEGMDTARDWGVITMHGEEEDYRECGGSAPFGAGIREYCKECGGSAFVYGRRNSYALPKGMRRQRHL